MDQAEADRREFDRKMTKVTNVLIWGLLILTLVFAVLTLVFAVLVFATGETA